MSRGGSRIFSRGAEFQKYFEILSPFFYVDQDLIELPSSHKLHCLGAHFPQNLSIYWRQKYIGPSAKNGDLKIVQRGALLVGRGSNL